VRAGHKSVHHSTLNKTTKSAGLRTQLARPMLPSAHPWLLNDLSSPQPTVPSESNNWKELPIKILRMVYPVCTLDIKVPNKTSCCSADWQHHESIALHSVEKLQSAPAVLYVKEVECWRANNRLHFAWNETSLRIRAASIQTLLFPPSDRSRPLAVIMW
jgi:hypothetical protein